jgi:hypothetical protein
MLKSRGPLAALLAGALALPAAAQEPPFATPPLASEAPSVDDGPNAFAPGPDSGKHAPPHPDDGPIGCFESDPAFPGFVGPISNPFLSKDPRSLTELRLVFLNNEIPTGRPLGGGNFQVIGLQARVALTERLTFIADKSGYAWIHPSGDFSDSEGFLNVAAGLRYLLVRDVASQFLWSVGAQFEPQTGSGQVYQNQGDGVMTAWTTMGKQFGDRWHLIGTVGYQFPIEGDQNSRFFYTSVHLDRRFCSCLYPLAELNWFHYSQGGDSGLPPSFGEGDGLINLGTNGVGGNDLVTAAVGLKATIGCHLETGAVYEFPITGRKDLIDNRVIFEVIVRY